MPSWINGLPKISPIWTISAPICKQQEKQLQTIADLLHTPFQQLENWQVYLQDSFAKLKEEGAKISAKRAGAFKRNNRPR